MNPINEAIAYGNLFPKCLDFLSRHCVDGIIDLPLHFDLTMRIFVTPEEDVVLSVRDEEVGRFTQDRFRSNEEMDREERSPLRLRRFPIPQTDEHVNTGIGGIPAPPEQESPTQWYNSDDLVFTTSVTTSTMAEAQIRRVVQGTTVDEDVFISPPTYYGEDDEDDD